MNSHFSSNALQNHKFLLSLNSVTRVIYISKRSNTNKLNLLSIQIEGKVKKTRWHFCNYHQLSKLLYKCELNQKYLKKNNFFLNIFYKKSLRFVFFFASKSSDF
ncbi:hypothetical protein Hanom_Chr11g00992311 [Helianthus anomalus]